MRKTLSVLAIVIPVMALAAVSFVYVHSAKADSVTCTPTGFMRDNRNLTAALINPQDTVSGPLDATGCNIGIYYSPGAEGKVNHAEIFGANYFGVVNNGAHVDIQNSRIHDIGETPLNGTQHGVAIYFAFEGGVTGEIESNRIWNYQKGGIVVNGPNSSATISENTVLGQGPINYIAQNGIQIGFGARGFIQDNTVTGNSYTGAGLTASGGIIVVGGDCYGGELSTDTSIVNNTVVGNDIGIWLSNLDASCGPATTPTNILVSGNISRNDAVNNTTGNGPGAGYQAGIADQGDGDKITGNKVCGVGYTPVANPPPYLFMIDVTVTNNVVVHGNTSCDNGRDPEDSSGNSPHGANQNTNDIDW
jgi:hypothetical protein